MLALLAKFALSGIGAVVAPIFNYLNAKVDAAAQVTIASVNAGAQVATSTAPVLQNADTLTAQRQESHAWGPQLITVTSIVGFLVPFAWHTWQVALDSSRWLPSVEWSGWLPYLGVSAHVVGSWHVSALPEPFGTTENAAITSLFVGASGAVAAVAAIRAIKR